MDLLLEPDEGQDLVTYARQKALTCFEIAIAMKSKGADAAAPPEDNQSTIAEAMKNGKVVIGMTKQQVQATWGPPHRVTTMNNASGESEQWDYDYDISGQTPRAYLHFDGSGTVTSVDTSNER